MSSSCLEWYLFLFTSLSLFPYSCLSRQLPDVASTSGQQHVQHESCHPENKARTRRCKERDKREIMRSRGWKQLNYFLPFNTKEQQQEVSFSLLLLSSKAKVYLHEISLSVSSVFLTQELEGDTQVIDGYSNSVCSSTFNEHTTYLSRLPFLCFSIQFSFKTGLRLIQHKIYSPFFFFFFLL